MGSRSARRAPEAVGLCVDRWSGLDGPTALEIERALRAEGLEPYRYSDPPGTVYAPHRHPSRQVRWLLSGRLRVQVAGLDDFVLGPGDRLDMPAGLVHAVRVDGQDPLVCVAAASR